MKKVIMLFFLWFASAFTFAASPELPDEVFVREHWVSLTKSYDIETKTQKLGTLYRRFFSFLMTYDFYDPYEVKTATARARFFSFGAYLDIYDQANAPLGAVEEKIFTFFPTFEIIAPDATTKLARAEMNFWGTKFYIYDPMTTEEMAVMSRPFFRVKDDWSIHVTNRDLLNQKNIDPRVLMTVLAVQGEIEDWRKKRDRDRDQDNDFNFKLKAVQVGEKFAKRIQTLRHQEGLESMAKPSQANLEALALRLENKFKAENPPLESQSPADLRDAMISYYLDMVELEEVSADMKNAILTLLDLRLQHKDLY